jgi:hypothetical protein
MQTTTTTRHFGPRQIKQATLALAILTSTAIGLTTATLVRDAADEDSGHAAVVTSSLSNRELTFGYSFLEQNLDLPTSGSVHAVNPPIDYRFMEQNLDLPVGAVSTAPDWQVIEQNSWGEGFVLDGSVNGLIPPSADDIPQQRSGEVIY